MASGGTSCLLGPSAGVFPVWRAGNRHETRTKEIGHVLEEGTYVFRYRYVVGYCSAKHQGTGPTLKLKLGTTELWSRQLDLATDDYPYDTSCGGCSTCYSAEQEAVFSTSENGAIILEVAMGDRNIEVVGSGFSCGPLRSQTPGPHLSCGRVDSSPSPLKPLP